ncbi:hypothetical protein FSP39_000600 [Pinctada imbricata]|uniref:Uncharacterized protein n=1 Tax=Pinctada imbricata TaxID=66713 RepID=A0AA88YGE7_PINIB|nr:hypothetical protein FSP39_000600 [Pinctada imbricata]
MDVVNNLDVGDLAEIIRKYGEERRYKQVAHAIVEARYTFGKISTTKQLAAIVESIYPEGSVLHDKMGRRAHVATRTFQALRIFVNNELNEINIGLHIANDYLREGGVCVAITFHSLEDRIVKRHFHGIDMTEEKCISIQQRVRRAYRGHEHFKKEEMEELLKQTWKPVKRGVITPEEEECVNNPRSRSAKLRAAYKISSYE